jgi:hypothetical protein
MVPQCVAMGGMSCQIIRPMVWLPLFALAPVGVCRDQA